MCNRLGYIALEYKVLIFFTVMLVNAWRNGFSVLQTLLSSPNKNELAVSILGFGETSVHLPSCFVAVFPSSMLPSFGNLLEFVAWKTPRLWKIGIKKFFMTPEKYNCVPSEQRLCDTDGLWADNYNVIFCFLGEGRTQKDCTFVQGKNRVGRATLSLCRMHGPPWTSLGNLNGNSILKLTVQMQFWNYCYV